MRYIQSKKFLVTLVAAFLLLAWLGGAPSVIPVAQAQSSTLYTQFTAQNLDATTAMNARVTYFNASGSPVLTTTHTVNPYRSITINQPSQVGLATTFNGSAVFDADKPFGLLVSEYNGTVGSLGTNFWLDGYIGATTPVTETVFPQLLKGVGIYNSRITIQNPNTGQSANVTIKFKQSTGEEYTHSGIVIAPSGSYSTDLATDSALTTVPMFFGTVRVTSTQPVTAVGYKNTVSPSSTYVGLASANAGTTLYVPKLLKNIQGAGASFISGSAVLVMTLDGTSANVTITYTSGDGGFTTSESTTANPMGQFDQRSTSALSSQSTFYGSGVITANKPIVAIVNVTTNTVANLGARVGGYRAFPGSAGATRVFMPMLRKYATDAATGVELSTGISGQLLGNSATTVTLTYYLPNGTTASESVTVSPSAPMFNFDQRNSAVISNGTVATGVLTTNPAQPIVVVGNTTATESYAGDVVLYYEGLGQ